MCQCLLILLCTIFSFSLCAKTTVLAFAGSARVHSINKKLVLEAAHIAKEMGADVNFIDLKDYPIPLYDSDLEAANGMPENAKRIRNLMLQSQIILIASPEHNSAPSALLKNTLDWLSRNEGGSPSREAFAGKKCILMSASPGSRGGSRGLVHLKDIIEDIGGVVDPHFITVGNATTAFDENGKLKNPQLYFQLEKVIQQALH